MANVVKCVVVNAVADPEGLSRVGGEFMASAGARAYMGSGAVPQCGPGAKPLVWGSGGEAH